MRTRNSILNITAGLANQFIITMLSFISRTVFISSLGIEYLGINALLANILGILALAEAGIGSSIVYSLYKPVAENNQTKIVVLMKFYRNAYLVIALIVLALGLLFLPFLSVFIKETDVENIHFIYLIFLMNTVLPYLFIHKNNFLNVCQKGYIVTAIFTVSSIITMCLKIAILYFTQNYILFLVIESITILLTSIILAHIVNKMYPYLKNKSAGKLDKETKLNIQKNVKAIVLQNFGNYLVLGTDNIIISSFISVTAVGLYANYNMLIEICRNFMYQISNNIYHSIGNLVAKEDSEKIYNIYKVYRLLNFWLYSFAAISLLVLINPFITLWIGSEFLMEMSVLLILVLLFFERGMRNPVATIKTTGGIFHADRYIPLFQAVINLIISIVLVQHLGIIGVFLGTLISTLVGPFWSTPYLVYKDIFKKPVYIYYSNYVVFCLLAIGTYMITSYLCSFYVQVTFLNLLIKVFVCLTVPNIIYLIIFYKSEEFKYMRNTAVLLIREKFRVNKKIRI
ncbi:hypothetical protein IEO70_04795 [Bacillus sp. AGMB 02131]|uniref:Flippase n=1 Tax=Peribacillus faecalis TaxID=2772559 RepID=A0A927HAL5_9BACI|nr:hypothetical protein [Peribacillus faecalis]MBD3107677.1 hypothetical protein [Peribacillus faecalis]